MIKKISFPLFLGTAEFLLPYELKEVIDVKLICM